MAVLVTGVGYIGAQLVKDLLAAGESEVVAVDNLFSTDPRVIAGFSREPRVRFIRGNIGRASVLKQAFESTSSIEAVYSLAAQSSAHPEAASPRYTENTNLLAPRLLLDAMVHYGVPTLVFASSFWVYGHHLPSIVSEETPYGRFGDLHHLSKCYVEKLLEMYAYRHGLRCLAIRLGVVYGLGPVMKEDYRFMTAPNKFSLQAARQEEIAVYGSGLSPTGFIHVADASRALRAAIECAPPGSYAAVNAVSEIMPVSTVAEIVAEEGKKRGFDVRFTLEGDRRRLAALPKVESKLDSAGFSPSREMRSSVGEMIDYFSRAERAS